MSEKQKLFDEQQAPLKNTDRAFVQVGHDGEPVVPQTSQDDQNDSPKIRPTEPEHQ